MQFFCRARCSAAPATAWGLAVYTSDGSRSHTRGPQSTSQGDNNTQVVEVGWAGTTCRWRLQSWFWPGGVQHLPLFAPRDDDLLLLWSSCTACGGDTVCWRKHLIFKPSLLLRILRDLNSGKVWFHRELASAYLMGADRKGLRIIIARLPDVNIRSFILHQLQGSIASILFILECWARGCSCNTTRYLRFNWQLSTKWCEHHPEYWWAVRDS